MRPPLPRIVEAVFTAILVLMGNVFQAASQADPGQSLFTRDDIESEILATSSLGSIDLTGGILTLEHLAVPSGGVFVANTGTTPEALAVISGDVAIQDGFGFGSSLTSGSGVGLGVGTEYQIANTGSGDAAILRAFVALPGQVPPTSIVEIQASPQAVPVVEVTRTTLAEIDVADAGGTGSSLVLGSVLLPADATTGEQNHDGPLVVYVDSGTISLVSPSGLQGNIQGGQAVGLPAQAPLIAQSGDEESVAYIVGIASEPPFTEVIPPPTPTPAPSPTPEPTMEPSPTPLPSPTPEPTADPAIEQGVRDWLTTYTELRNACDTFGIADLYAEPNTFEWNRVEESLPCKFVDQTSFWIDGDIQVRVTEDQATIGFTWIEERLESSDCKVWVGTETLHLQFIDGRWRPADDETFGTSPFFSEGDRNCQVILPES